MFMLDTNICIFAIKKKNDKLLERIKKNRHKGLFVSGITLAELEFGIENAMPEYRTRNTIALMEFLTIFGIRDFDEKAAKEYGKIKKDLKDRNCLIGPLDMLIGAHAKSLNMKLITNNTVEFTRIQGLPVDDWTK